MEIFQRIGAVEAAGVSAEVDGHRVAASRAPIMTPGDLPSGGPVCGHPATTTVRRLPTATSR
jgi:hypothetical protein